MAETLSSRDRPGRPAVAAKIAVAVVLLVAVVAVGILLVIRFIDGERERELQVWQTRLGIIADSRTEAVDGWLGRQFAALGQLADNASLQLYMTELAALGAAPGRATEDIARSGYLRNLLTVVADRAGFAGPTVGPAVDANVRRIGVAGIALVDVAGRIVAASEAMPPLDGRLARFLAEAPGGERALLDIHRGAAATPTMAFAAPVFSIQGSRAGADRIGWVLGVKEVARELYPLLKPPGTVWRSAEALLVRREGAAVAYLSPTLGGDAPLARTLAADTLRLAAAGALARPGGFAIGRDYQGNEVLYTARRIALAPWALLYKIDRKEALGPSDARFRRLVAIFLLVIALVAAALVAAWWHGTSRRAAAAAADYEAMARRFEGQSRFLRLVTDSQPNAMFIVDGENRYRFANRAATARAGIAADDMIGKTMASVIGPAEADRTRRFTREVMETGEAISHVHRSGADGDLRVIQAKHIPVRDEGELGPGVMVVEEDITAAVSERERRERTLERLVETLVAITDRRDPFAANHSARVATVARAIAEEMGLDDEVVRTAETAGRLMNIGKVLVPSAMLTRAGALDEAEIRLVRDSIQQSADLLEAVEFEGPVAETLRQIQERWDGTGTPRGLAGEEILVSAQIVAAANAFVAVVGPRSWREGIGIDEAVARLMEQADAAFTRRVASALMNLVDNRGARAAWQSFAAADDDR